MTYLQWYVAQYMGSLTLCQGFMVLFKGEYGTMPGIEISRQFQVFHVSGGNPSRSVADVVTVRKNSRSDRKQSLQGKCMSDGGHVW